MASRTPFPRVALTLLAAAFLAGCEAFPKSEASIQKADAAARVDYYEEAAKTYYEGGRYAQAVSMWDKVLESHPDDQWAKFGLAKSLQMEGSVANLRRAETILKGIVGLEWTHPTRGDIRFEVQTTFAEVYSDLSDYYARDLAVLENRIKKASGPDTKLLQEHIDDQKAKRDELLRASMPLWQQVLAHSPDNPYALAGLSKANLIAGDETLGVQYGERYVALSQRSQTGWEEQLKEWRKRMRGEVSEKTRDWYMQKIRGAREKELGMLLLLGSVHMRREEFGDAVRCYNRILDQDPASIAALVERAQAYAGMGLFPEAIVDLEQYLKLTDATKHREARIDAAELLDRYRQIVARQPVPTVAAPSGMPAASAPALPPPVPHAGGPDG